MKTRPKFWFTPKVGALAPIVQRELQYAVQQRLDGGIAGWRADTHTGLVEALSALNLTSLRDLQPLVDAATPRVTEKAKAANGELKRLLKDANHRGFVRFALDCLTTLELAATGQNEYDRDVWRMRHLGFAEHELEGVAALDFRPIGVPWLRALAKRWIKWRISIGTRPATLHGYVRGLHTFMKYLATEDEPLTNPEDLDRDVMLDYALWLKDQGRAVTTRRRELTALNTLLHQVRINEWEPRLRWNAAYFRGEIQLSAESQPRFLPPGVVRQLQSEGSICLLPGEVLQTMVRVALETGLRSCDLRRLPLDCIYLDGDGAPNLRPFNWKLGREFAIPISVELHEHIRAQQSRVRARHPATRWLFPRTTRNPDGEHPYTYGAYKQQLGKWVESLDLRDDNNAKIKVTGHMFRHSVATLMINNGMPIAVVQAYLDHDSITSTMVYAKVVNATLRREWEKAQAEIRVNIEGDVIPDELGAMESTSRWLKDEFARASQTVAHGWCGLPIQQKCPHANACWSCDHFSTGPLFLGGIKTERVRTLRAASEAQKSGRVRAEEMNNQVAENMTKVIAAIENAMDQHSAKA